MKNIYYIGTNETFYTELVMYDRVVVKSSKSVMGLLNSRFYPEYIVIDQHPMATSVQNLVRTIREKGYVVPIYILGDNMAKEEKLLLLKLGISEIVDSVTELIRVILYQSELLDDGRVSTASADEIEYRIPLWKRMFDIAFSGTILLLIFPILLLIAAAIYIESPGPVLYRSKRVGTGYQVFDFLKFRSMYVNADRKLKEMKDLNQYETEEVQLDVEQSHKQTMSSELLVGDKGELLTEAEWAKMKQESQSPTFIKIKNDPRITKVGRFIRSTSLDELPQFLNVLRGDMSVVGNRPLPLYEAVELTTDQWAARFLAPAGITGLWQVEKRGKEEMSETERKELDIEYALNVGLRMDLRIILKTVPALMQRENV